MFEFLKNLLGRDAPKPSPVRKAPPPRRERPTPRATEMDVVEIDTEVSGQIESIGPGKNVLIRNKYQREDSGTHETLKIVDDDLLKSDDEAGIDPYNTGNFDRSRNWDKRFRN